MGLCNNNLDAMKRDCRKLDKTVAKDNINAMEKVCAQFESKVQEMLPSIRTKFKSSVPSVPCKNKLCILQ